MAKTVDNVVLDAMLEYLQTNGNKMTVCEGQPTTFEHANSAKGTGTGMVLADVTLDSGDYAIADGTSGRQVTVAAQSEIDIDQSGTGSHVAIVDTVNSRLLYVSECTSIVLPAGSKVNFPAWIISVGDPT